MSALLNRPSDATDGPALDGKRLFLYHRTCRREDRAPQECDPSARRPDGPQQQGAQPAPRRLGLLPLLPPAPLRGSAHAVNSGGPGAEPPTTPPPLPSPSPSPSP